MNQRIRDFLSAALLGDPQTHERMAVVPILSPLDSGPVYLTLEEAVGANVLIVTEVSEGGSVPELSVNNQADLPVLLLDGEELIGAKQNRVLNTTILLKEKTVTIIPVSCVEHGRWGYSSPTMHSSGHVSSPSLRLSKARSVSASLRAEGKYRSDQGEVWDQVACLSMDLGADSKTGAMHDAFEARRQALDGYLAAFQRHSDQIGLLALIDGHVIGLDLLARRDPFGKLYEKLLRSYAIEALRSVPLAGVEKAKKDEAVKPAADPVQTARDFLASLDGLVETAHQSVGYGCDHRLTGSRIVGSALVVDEAVVHAAFFPGESDDAVGRRSNFMSNASRRRSYRQPPRE